MRQKLKGGLIKWVLEKKSCNMVSIQVWTYEVVLSQLAYSCQYYISQKLECPFSAIKVEFRINNGELKVLFSFDENNIKGDKEKIFAIAKVVWEKQIAPIAYARLTDMERKSCVANS